MTKYPQPEAGPPLEESTKEIQLLILTALLLCISSIAQGSSIFGGGSSDGYHDRHRGTRIIEVQINNADGATNVLDTSAWLNGTLMSTGTAATTVYLYWGQNDGTNNAAVWANTNDFGQQAEGASLATNVTLIAGRTYYYRFYATNANGEAWAWPSASFDTDPAAVVNNAVGATNVLNTSAWLTGNLTSTGSASTTVRVYWGMSDGTNDVTAWANTNDFGVQTEGAELSTNVTVLSENTIYYYRFYATNENGDVWAESSTNFVTHGPPTVDNGTGADLVGSRRARLNGNLTTYTPLTHVYIYWGLDTNNWADTNYLSELAEGAFNSYISGLAPSTEYFYQCFASNSYGADWADTATNFTTAAAVSIYEGGSSDGYDRFWSTATAIPGVYGTVFTIQ